VKFGDTPIDEATGAILAHSWRANGINFAKGRVLSADDVSRLKAAGASSVIAARLDPEDMHEDEAAATLAKALAGEGIEVTAPFTGRCNHFAREAGLAVIDHERIDALNELDEAVTVATLPPFARVSPRQMVATVKIIPYAAPRAAVDRAIGVAKESNQPMVSVAPFRPMRAGLVQTRLPGTRDKALDKAVSTTSKRLTSLGSRRTHAKRKERLAEVGISDEQFARIHGPVGLNIGAKSPAEIAVSILGQIVEVRARRLEALAAPKVAAA